MNQRGCKSELLGDSKEVSPDSISETTGYYFAGSQIDGQTGILLT